MSLKDKLLELHIKLYTRHLKANDLTRDCPNCGAGTLSIDILRNANMNSYWCECTKCGWATMSNPQIAKAIQNWNMGAVLYQLADKKPGGIRHDN